jgi:16S rRNA (guanine527-N7)-methyltransferase
MFHVKHEGLAPVPGVRLTRPQRDRIDQFEALLRERAVPVGAIARGEVPHLRRRHIEDALRGVAALPVGTRSLCDLGSGAGLPGVPIAIARPDIDVTLAERRRARRAFLELVVDEVGLRNVTVCGGIERIDGPFDVCTARAFADVAGSWSAADRLIRPGGVLLYWAGEDLDLSTRPAGVSWRPVDERPLAPGGPVVIMGRE